MRGDSEGNINIYNAKTRECRNTNTGRGAVRKISFSPGKSNLKMVVVYGEWIQIWDARDLELINELKESGSEAEWGSSDRLVVAGREGGLRVVGLALAGSTSPAGSYGREQVPACWAQLPAERSDCSFSRGVQSTLP